MNEGNYGQIVILNGTPRSGKTSIANVMQKKFDGVWMNIGVDGYMKMIPEQYQPGIGLRPGGERPDLEPIIQLLYKALYESIAAHSRLGINVVVDVGHHDHYSVPRAILRDCARILNGLPVLFVGVRCPIEVVMERRLKTWYVGYDADGSVPYPIQLWQEAVHIPGIYDMELDTSILTAVDCAERIRERLQSGQPTTAFQRIRGMETG